jgi:MFS family permease
MNQNINYKYTIGYVVTAAIGMFNLGYSYSYFNTCTKIIHPQFVFNNKYVIEDRDLFNSVISALVPFGAIFGAPIGGTIASLGRRPALIMISTVFAIASLVTTYMNFFSLFIGRLIMGICIGAYLTVTPLIVSELSPKSIAGPLGVIGQFMCVTGILLAVSLGFLVPYAEDDDSLTTNIWRTLFRIPIVFSSIQIFMLLFVFTLDTPTFYEQRNDSVNYEKSMNKLYSNPKYVYVMSSLLDEPTVTVPYKPQEIGWNHLFTSPN